MREIKIGEYLLVGLLLVHSNINAAEEAKDSSIAEIVVTARREFLSVDTSGTTNLPIPIEKVPQSISLVTLDFMKAAELKTLADVAEYTPGAIQGGAPENTASRIKLRGFDSGTYVDGLDAPISGFEDDYVIYERAEFVKGPSSVVYGAGGPGGLVNFVTKRGGDRLDGYVRGEYGSWNGQRLEGQVGGPIDADGRVKALAIGAFEQGNSHVHVVNHSSTLLYGAIDLVPTPAVSAYLNGGYRHFSRTGFDGVPPLPSGEPALVPRDYFLGSSAPLFKTRTNGAFANSGVNWRAAENLSVKLKANFSSGRTTGAPPFGSGLDATGAFTLIVDGPLIAKSQSYDVGLWTTYTLPSPFLKDSVITASIVRQDSRQRVLHDAFLINGSPYASANLLDGERSIAALLNSGVVGPFSGLQEVLLRFTTVSVQAFLRPVEKFSILLGASRSKPQASVFTEAADYSSNNIDFNFNAKSSYRAGLGYEFLPRANGYVSFSQSFLPQTVLDRNNAPLPPLTGEQYEAGVKVRSVNDRLLVTGAVFQIRQLNAAQYDAFVNNGDKYRAIGQVRHRGIELQALGHITDDWQINAGYSLLDATVRADSDPTTVGKTRPFLPRHAASVFSTYRFPSGPLAGLTIGGGGRYLSSESTGFDRSTSDLRGYTLVDAMASFDIGLWTIQANGRNLLDKRYYTSNWDTLFYGLVSGAPRNGTLAVNRRF